MKTDIQLQKDVLAELAWDPSIKAAHVGVAVNDGVVLLSGHLDTFGEKHAVERAVQRVAGVRAIAVELNARGVEARGGQWHATTVARVLKRKVGGEERGAGA